jgi:hypothetical protein
LNYDVDYAVFCLYNQERGKKDSLWFSSDADESHIKRSINLAFELTVCEMNR